MVSKKLSSFNIPEYIISTFHELCLFQYLQKANIYKRNGHEVKTIFTVVFSLVFQHITWNRLVNSKVKESLPSKDAVYRFLSNASFNWRKFILLVSARMIQLCSGLTDCHRTKVFVIDDSPYDRSRSKKTEMLSTIFDHVSHKFFNGYHLLTLGWSDGATFVPVDFSLVATRKNLINDIDETIDKRTIVYKRRSECLSKKTDLTITMLERALNHGIYASHVLMDSWFSSAKMFERVSDLGLDMIGMLKSTTKQFFQYGNKSLNIHQLFNESLKHGRHLTGTANIIRGITVEMLGGKALRIVFVVNRNNKSEWLAIASSDTILSDEEIIRIYEKRWSIETFFKAIKSTFRLEKEFQVQSFDALIAHTSIVFTRYIVVSWEIRKNSDDKTLGNLFYLMCDDIRDVTFIEALKTLVTLINELSASVSKQVTLKIEGMMNQWYEMMPKWLSEALIMSSNV